MKVLVLCPGLPHTFFGSPMRQPRQSSLEPEVVALGDEVTNVGPPYGMKVEYLAGVPITMST